MFQKLATILAPMAAAMLFVAVPVLAVAQTSAQGKTHSGMQDESGAMMDCQQMVKMKEQMQAKQQMMQTELDGMVARMNAASGTTQQQAMAELLTKLVENRGAMTGMMTTMQPMMMQHMMHHMTSGDMSAMSTCPMMKSMQRDGESGKPDGEHKDHH